MEWVKLSKYAFFQISRIKIKVSTPLHVHFVLITLTSKQCRICFLKNEKSIIWFFSSSWHDAQKLYKNQKPSFYYPYAVHHRKMFEWQQINIIIFLKFHLYIPFQVRIFITSVIQILGELKQTLLTLKRTKECAHLSEGCLVEMRVVV